MAKRKRSKNKMVKKQHSCSIVFLILSILIGIIYTKVSASATSSADIKQIQEGISEKIIRFHVLANSDSEADQQLKLKVKDQVVTYTKGILANSKSIQESEQILIQNTPQIIQIAETVIKENGYDYSVTAGITNTYFPTKSYGNYTFPPGEYKAYQIKIGKAEGHNWWCVLYPPLCFVDISHGVVDKEGEHMLENTLTTEEYSAVKGDYPVKYRFKYLKFLNKLMN